MRAMTYYYDICVDDWRQAIPAMDEIEQALPYATVKRERCLIRVSDKHDAQIVENILTTFKHGFSAKFE